MSSTYTIDFSDFKSGNSILAAPVPSENFKTAFFFSDDAFDLMAVKIEQAKAVSLANCYSDTLKTGTAQSLSFLLRELIEQIEALYIAHLKKMADIQEGGEA